jgi:hypothetical protein
MKPIERMLRVAAEQHGAVSVAQARECGMSWKAQKAAEARGQLRIVEPGVLVVFGAPDTWHQRLQIGLLAPGPDAWVSHEAAAALLDLAYLGVPPKRLAAAIDSAVRHGWSAIRVIEQRLAELRGPGRRGVRTLDRLMPDSGGDTPLERTFLGIMRTCGLPRPVTQFRAIGPKGFIARVDFLFEAFEMVVEVTGRKGWPLIAAGWTGGRSLTFAETARNGRSVST